MIKLKLLKTNILFLVAIIFFSCSNVENEEVLVNENLKKSILELERSFINNDFPMLRSVELEDIPTEFNSYDDVAYNYIIFIDDLKTITETDSLTLPQVEDYIDSRINEFSELSLDISNINTELILKSFGNTIDLSNNDSLAYNVIEVSKIYEEFVNNNTDITPEVRENLMAGIAFHKWLGYRFIVDGYSNEPNRGCGQRDCFDCCMYTKLKNMTWGGLIVWTLGTPAISTGYMVLECLIDCGTGQL